MDKHLPILGIETSGDMCSVCLYENEKRFVENNVLAKHIHSEKLFTIIETTTKTPDDNDKIGSIAVSAGPGSFTGLRIGMAAAKGIAIGKDIPIIPVPTMHAFAFGIMNYFEDTNTFIIANTVNRDEIYFSRFQKKNDTLLVLNEPQLMEAEHFEKEYGQEKKVYGSHIQKRRTELLPFPTALNICRWAYFFGKELLTYHFDYLEPDYLKNFVAKVKND